VSCTVTNPATLGGSIAKRSKAIGAEPTSSTASPPIRWPLTVAAAGTTDGVDDADGDELLARVHIG